MLNRLLLLILLLGISYTASKAQLYHQLMDYDGKKSLGIKISSPLMHDLLSQNQENIKGYLSVFVGSKQTKGQYPMLGSYSLENEWLIFTPTFSFRDGLTYTAVIENSESISFEIPLDKNHIPTQLTEVYPSGQLFPENQLKLYLQFSAPMSEGNIYQYIHITNKWGDTLDKPFLHLEPELWDERHQRLTVWFDPGRIKRDLGPNQHLGTPLQEGQAYRLHISQKWKDIEGYSMKKAFIKAFYVGKADRKKPNTQSWHLSIPEVKTLDSLSILFPNPMDYALLQNSIDVLNEEGEIVNGKVKLGNNERKWLFLPAENWQPGNYKIRVSAVLEDLAGNNLNRLFDRDLYAEDDVAEEHSYYWLNFQIKAAQD